MTATAAVRTSGFAPGGIRVPPVPAPYAIDYTPGGQVPPVLTDAETWLVTLRADLQAIDEGTPP